MRKLKQPERILRILCFTLAAVLVYELVRAVMHLNPLSGVALPAVPSLAGACCRFRDACQRNQRSRPSGSWKEGDQFRGTSRSRQGRDECRRPQRIRQEGDETFRTSGFQKTALATAGHPGSRGSHY